MYNKSNKSNKDLKLFSVREFPADMHQWIKVEAAKKGVTISEFLVEICTYWQQNHPPKE